MRFTLLQSRSSHRRCSIKKLFLKISQFFTGNTCVGISFYFKILQDFYEVLQFYEEHLLWRTSTNGCFWECVHETEINQKLPIRNFNSTVKKHDFSTSLSETREKAYFMIGFLWSLSFTYNISLTWWEINSKQ